jgi:hypothetical protein
MTRSILAPVFRGLSVLPGDPQRRRDALFLAALVLGQAVLLWRTAPSFFDGDAFFYLAHPVEHARDVARAFTATDVAGQYRPLGAVAVGCLFRPLFGLDYRLYAATALAAHLANTLLVFLVLRGLRLDGLALRAATVFWALDPVAIYVTHSFSFLPDFSYAFFYLGAILAFLQYTRTGSRRAFALALGAFVLSLLSKELAITLPPVLILISVAFLRDAAEFRVDRARRLVGALLVPLALYLALYAFVRGGDFYDASAAGNYFPRFDLQTLLAKASSWLGALYLPLPESLPGGASAAWSRRLVYAAMPLLLLLAVFVLWPPAETARRVRAGVLWSLVGASPVLFLSPTEFTHNLYVPALGLAVVVGSFWGWLSAEGRLTGWIRPAPLHAYGLGLVLFSVLVNQAIFESGNWRPYWERVARIWVDETRQVVPGLGPRTALYVLRTPESSYWNLYKGDLLRVFYREPGLTVGFDDEGDPLPREAAKRGEAFVLCMLDGHLHDVTAAVLREDTAPGTSLVDQFARAPRSLVSGRPEESMRFETPNGKPVFTAPVLVGDDYRRALVTLGGVRVRVGVVVTGSGRLSFGVTKRFESGDGVVARVYFDGAGGRRLIFERALDPTDVPADRRWFDEAIDLGAFRGQTGVIELECDPGPRGDYVADWLAWSGLRLEGAYSL